MKGYITDKIKILDNGCWEWLGAKSSHGYGIVYNNHKINYVHRLTFYQYKYSIPKGKQIDHLCRNRICCNPHHLEIVTPKTNVLRGISSQAKNKRKTHCKNGHEFTKENTIIQNGDNRRCRKCHYDYNNRRYKKISSI